MALSHTNETSKYMLEILLYIHTVKNHGTLLHLTAVRMFVKGAKIYMLKKLTCMLNNWIVTPELKRVHLAKTTFSYCALT